MNLEQYSVVLSAALVLLSITTIISILAFAFSRQAGVKMQGVDYFVYIKLIGVLSILATIGALVYQFVYKTPVCEYCWWQRIFMFPIDVIVLVTVWKKIKFNEIIIGILAAIGSFFASVHYYFHVQVAIFDNILTMPCSGIGIIPSCTTNHVLIWGFITIPLMALTVFLVILWLVFLARYSTRKVL